MGKSNMYGWIAKVTLLLLLLANVKIVVDASKSKSKSKTKSTPVITQPVQSSESYMLNSNATHSRAHDFSPYYHAHCKLNTEKCVVLDLSIESLSKSNLIRSLENADFLRQEQELLGSHHVLYAVISIRDVLNFDTLHQQYEELDAFILERPWWKVQQYPVIFQKQPHAIPLLLEHLPNFVTEVSKNLLAVHFPPAEDCLKRKLFVRAASSSWGIDLANVDDYFNKYPDSIHGFFIASQGKTVNEGYVEKSKAGCADKVNLRTCSFLETTNCTYPASFLKFCSGNDCPKSGMYDIFNRSYIGQYDQPDAVHLPAAQVLPAFAKWKPYTGSAYKTHHPSIVDATTAEYSANHNNINQLNVYQLQWKYGIAYKYNYHLGVRIQEFLQEFYGMYHKPDKGQSFTVHDRCVGVHIRKGDRTLPGVDMIEWCKNHTLVQADGSRTFTGNWINGQPMTRGNFADMGCGYNMPFGTVNIQHIVNGSLLLANETLYSAKHRLNVLVMTDEIPTLEQEVAEFQKTGYARDKVRIVVFPTKLENVHKSRLSWQATAEWWAGIEAMKHCSGFIMHTSSAASSAIFNSMCYNHGEGYMKCPPAMFFE